MSLKEQAASGIKWTSLSAGINSGLNFIQTAVLANLLAPADFGLMSMVMIVVGFAQLFSDMGVSKAIICRQETTREQLSTLYWLNVGSGLFVGLIIIVSSPWVASFYGEPRLRDLVLWASLIFIITPFGQQFQFLFQKELEFNLLAWFGMAAFLVNTVFAIVLAILGAGVYALVFGQIANAVTRVLLLTLWGWRRWRPKFHFRKSDLRGYLSFGMYQMGDNAANYFNSYIVQILLGAILGARQLGYYTLAYELVFKPIQVINPIITRVAFPLFAKIQYDRGRIKKGYLKIQGILSFVNFPLTLGMAGVAPLAVPLIYGAQWMPSVILIQILAPAALLCSAGSPVGLLLLAAGRADWSFLWNVGKMVIQIPILYLSTRWYGMLGAAIAFLSLQCLMIVLAYLFLIRSFLGPCLPEYLRSMWPPFWTSVAMAAGVFLLGLISLPSHPGLLLALQISGGAGIYLILGLMTQKDLMQELRGLLWRQG